MDSGGNARCIAFGTRECGGLLFATHVSINTTAMCDRSIIVTSLRKLLATRVVAPVRCLRHLPGGLVPSVAKLVSRVGTTRRKMPLSGVSNKLASRRVVTGFRRRFPRRTRGLERLPPRIRTRILRGVGTGVNKRCIPSRRVNSLW